jgi:hypothetical protein
MRISTHVSFTNKLEGMKQMRAEQLTPAVNYKKRMAVKPVCETLRLSLCRRAHAQHIADREPEHGAGSLGARRRGVGTNLQLVFPEVPLPK